MSLLRILNFYASICLRLLLSGNSHSVDILDDVVGVEFVMKDDFPPIYLIS